ncbi:MAG: hypothetical protein HGA44_12255 [Cellulomonadaceae bacterium]|nr:hypothetical protein [Cellulomonadaceae bacterium]
MAQILSAVVVAAAGLGVGTLIAYSQRRVGRLATAAVAVLAVAGAALAPRLMDNGTAGVVTYLVCVSLSFALGLFRRASAAERASHAPSEPVV